VRSLGTFDPKVITEGTLAYGLVFPSGFKAVLIGSAGPITPGVRALAEKLGPVDVAIVAYQVHAVADTQIDYTWPFIELFKPKRLRQNKRFIMGVVFQSTDVRQGRWCSSSRHGSRHT
jgi:hypothetical protein